MKFWLSAALALVLAVLAAFTIKNEYFFFAAYVVLQFVILATAWNILGGYAGYVNFGTGAFFGIGAYTGVLLIIVGPVDPNLDRLYIGRTFCVVVLAGLGSMSGTLVAGLILGVAESIVLSTAGTAWAPAVAFGILLLVLGVRPAGLFGR